MIVLRINDLILTDMLNKQDLVLDNGPSFPWYFQVMALVILFSGLGIFSSGIYNVNLFGIFGGLPIIYLGIFMITSRYGTQISFKNNQIREYHSRFFIKKGKWYDLNIFPDISVLKISRTMVITDRSGSNSESLDQSKNEVFLLSKNHRKKILLKTCNSIDEARNVANAYAELLKKNIVKFSPKISQQTLNRRR